MIKLVDDLGGRCAINARKFLGDDGHSDAHDIHREARILQILAGMIPGNDGFNGVVTDLARLANAGLNKAGDAQRAIRQITLRIVLPFGSDSQDIRRRTSTIGVGGSLKVVLLCAGHYGEIRVPRDRNSFDLQIIVFQSRELK